MIPRVQRGQPIARALTANGLNAAFRAAEQIDRLRLPEAIAGKPSSLLVRVKNTGSEPVGIYCPVGVGNALTVLASGSGVALPREMIFEAIQPVEGEGWGIAQEAIPSDQSGWVLLAGATYLWVSIRASGQKTAKAIGLLSYAVGGDGRFDIHDTTAIASGAVRLCAGVLNPVQAACARRFTLSVTGNPSGGTFTLRVSRAGGSPQVLTFNFDDTQAAAKTTLATYSGGGGIGLLSSEIAIEGPGDLPNNNLVIAVPADVTVGALSGSADGLTRRGLLFPAVRVDLCCS